MSDLCESVVRLVRDRGYQRREEPFRLASGQLSYDYIDGKRAIAHGDDLALVVRMLAEAVQDPFDAIGGLTMGADPIAHATAVILGCQWFSIRKQPKGRGLDQWIEGAQLGPGVRVLLVDDVVSTGGSILQAYDRVVEAGATVVGAVTLVNRGDYASKVFADMGLPYRPLVTYSDLGIEPVGSGVPAP